MAHLASSTMGTESLSEDKSAGTALTTYPHLTPKLNTDSRVIPLHHLWDFMACKRANSTLIMTMYHVTLCMQPYTYMCVPQCALKSEISSAQSYLVKHSSKSNIFNISVFMLIRYMMQCSCFNLK
jgi:hypothetical protein